MGAVQVPHGADLRRWPLVGRDDEVELATTALATIGSVVLTGAAGVGKTRLAHEVLANVATEQGRTAWVTATQSAAAIPLGAVAHLVPEAAIVRGRDATLRSIVAALRQEEGTQLILGVDDAHLLDDASAALVQLLVAGGTASAVVTVRSGEPVPDAIASLWEDRAAPLVALHALARAEVDKVVTAALGDPVDGGTLHFLWEASRGNALFLRELVRHGVESRALRCERGLWRWVGRLELDERLHSLVAMRIGSLTVAEQAALELIAVGQPLAVACARFLGVGDLVAQLERRGLVVADQRQRGAVALAHPLFGENLRDRMTPMRRAEAQLAVADAVESTGHVSAIDPFRIALWRVDAGDRSRPQQSCRAAARALRLWEPVIAERLARAALDAGPEMEAAYLLGAALSDQNRAGEALEAFRFARSLDGPDRRRAAIAADEAGVLSHQLGRLSDAERVLADTLEQVQDPEARAVLEGGRAAILVSSGNVTHGEADSPAIAVPTAALAALIDNATSGRLDRAVRIADEQLATAPEWTDEFPTIELYLQLARTWALILGGDLAGAQEHADAGYATALEEGAEFPRSTWSFVRGVVFVARGLPHRATRALQEAATGFELADRGFLRPSHTYLAMAAALHGDAAVGELHLQAAHDAKPSYDGLFGIDLARAGAWLMAARGELSTAAEGAERAADLAAERQASALEVLALHDVVRFGHGSDAAGRLETLATHVDGAFVHNAAAHARAVAHGDGPALDEVAASFSFLRFDLFAAEASAAAARVHRHEGMRARAFAARERAHELSSRCESARSHGLEWVDQPEDLTSREREIANLAREELASREIAERLGITTRTVDNLLGRVYAKLGVSGRQELASTLGRLTP